jgi:hypothetical protein
MLVTQAMALLRETPSSLGLASVPAETLRGYRRLDDASPDAAYLSKSELNPLTPKDVKAVAGKCC